VIRDLRESDLPILREIYGRCGYGFDFPDFSGLFHKHGKRKGQLFRKETAFAVLDDAGSLVGATLAQREAQIIGIFDPKWGTPGERMRTFAELHKPIAEKLEKQGVKEAYVAIDPKYPAFGRRLMSLGWKKANWTQYFLKVADCLAWFRKRAA
jgi:hypothetical protein